MHIREYKPDPFFRASIDTMDDLEDCKTYVAEYFCFKMPRHGEAVFTDLDDADEFLFQVYEETTPDLPPAERRSGWLRADAFEVLVDSYSPHQAAPGIRHTPRP